MKSSRRQWLVLLLVWMNIQIKECWHNLFSPKKEIMLLEYQRIYQLYHWWWNLKSFMWNKFNTFNLWVFEWHWWRLLLIVQLLYSPWPRQEVMFQSFLPQAQGRCDYSDWPTMPKRKTFLCTWSWSVMSVVALWKLGTKYILDVKPSVWCQNKQEFKFQL